MPARRQDDAPTRLEGIPTLVGPKLLALRDLVRVGGGDLRIVGGAVRDVLRGETPKDLDVAFHDPSHRMAEYLEAVGMEFRSPYGDWLFLTREDGFAVDLISAGRMLLPGEDPWDEDLRARDLTMNAMGASLEGDLFDPCGGFADAVAGRVRWNGLGTDRIDRDPVRIVRWARFRSAYGEPLDADALFDGLPPDGPDTPDYYMWRLGGASTDRLVKEIGRIHDLSDPEPALRFLDGLGAAERLGMDTLAVPLPELAAAIDAGRSVPKEDDGDAPSPA